MAGPVDDATRPLRGVSGRAATPRSAANLATAGATPDGATLAQPSPGGATVSDTGAELGDRALAETLMQSADAPDLVGKTLDRYKVLAKLGSGGMGVVYAALDPALDRRVALKVLPPIREDKGIHLEARLRREAQALARLDHPHVVRVYDVGVAEQSVFVAMQLVDGCTLADWLEVERPPARRIIAMYADAARGLAAAHEAGIVHRDVKPSNLLVDRAGRVYVGDFGLARGSWDESEERAPTSSDSNLLDEAMTREGSVLGTPLFMSPEQHHGDVVTSRSDQFSLCVSLWQALFGQHPFVDGKWTTSAALDAMARDAVREPPRGRGVPARVVRALRRGLRSDPIARWPSMATFAAELEPRSRVRWIAAGLALAGIAGGVGLAMAVGAVSGADPCASAGDKISTVWGAAQALAVRDGFAATGLSYAPNAAGQVITRIDRYARDWSAMRVDACRATRERGEQSDAMLDRRMRCLDRRLGELAAAVRPLGRAPTPDTVDRGLAIAESLTGLDECSDVGALADLREAPATPPRRAQVTAIDAELTRLTTALELDPALDERADADRLVAAARATDDGPLSARALLFQGKAREAREDYDQALASWREAARLAARAHDDRAATVALHAVADTLVGENKHAEALQTIDDAAIYGARVGGNLALQADLAELRARALAGLDRFAESDEAFDHAMALQAQLHGKDSYDALHMMVNRADILRRANRYDEAIGLVTHALPVLEKVMGRASPQVAGAHQVLGNIYLDQGKNDQARHELEQSLAIKRTRFPTGHTKIANALQSLGGVELDVGDLTAADRDFQEAYDIRRKALGEDNAETLSSAYELGVTRRLQGRVDEARALLEHVLEGRIHLFGENHTSVANVVDALANVAYLQRRYDDAIASRRRALAIREKVLGPDAQDVTISLLGLAELERDADHCTDALAHVARVLDIDERSHASWWDRIEPLGISALCETHADRLEALRAQLAPMVELAMAGSEVSRRADTQFALGIVLWKQGERAKGRALVEKGAATYRAAGLVGEAQPMDQWLKLH